MSKKPPYYRVRRGRAFFELGAQRGAQASMRTSYPLGEAGDAAKASGWKLYAEYRAAMLMPTIAPEMT
jgi:hypothetical protein